MNRKIIEKTEGIHQRADYCPLGKTWFGKDCPYLSARWEDDDHNSKPVLVFCNHKKNKIKYEGNCNKNDCPILNS